MDAQVFWKVIGEYNSQTIMIQICLVAVIALGLIVSYTGKIAWMAKLVLSIANLYIGVIFFGVYGTEAIQKYFALPLYICCGALFLYEYIKTRKETLQKPNLIQVFLLVLYALYPCISFALGNTYPTLVTYIMPCPLASLSIAVYSGYRKKNIVLLVLLTIWGLTGIKSILFHAYEDIILLVCGIYGLYLIYTERNKKMLHKSNLDLSGRLE